MRDHRPRMNSVKLFHELTDSWEIDPTPQRIKLVALLPEMPELDLDTQTSQRDPLNSTRDNDNEFSHKNGKIFEGNLQKISREIKQNQIRKHEANRMRFLSDFTNSKNQTNSILYYLESKRSKESRNGKQSMILGEDQKDELGK